ncbi:hypothetical protein L6452_17354 [Arctium lappa]|uniref:Uncharacterized protein n=1 Tax=Arctium lappa TaxID=4217 RepID=A0ACB9C387_ARCLA|nr:hypothetical protein L6452_17354 [Arctium lappa]
MKNPQWLCCCFYVSEGLVMAYFSLSEGAAMAYFGAYPDMEEEHQNCGLSMVCDTDLEEEHRFVEFGGQKKV